MKCPKGDMLRGSRGGLGTRGNESNFVQGLRFEKLQSTRNIIEVRVRLLEETDCRSFITVRVTGGEVMSIITGGIGVSVIMEIVCLSWYCALGSHGLESWIITGCISYCIHYRTGKSGSHKN